MRRGGLTIRQRCGDVLFVLAWAALVWWGVSILTGGFVLRAGSLAIATRSPLRPFVAAIVLALASWLVLGKTSFDERAATIVGPPARRLQRVAGLTACVVFAVAVAWNTRAVGGSDSSCYVLQAQAFAQGHASLAPVLAPLPAGVPAAALAPTGFLPSPRDPLRAVPICAAGLALMMTPAMVAGRELVFLVVPLFAAIAIWYTFALGRMLADNVTGACAAVLLAASPIFLYQSVQPMSDVPASALWLVAFVSLARGTRRGAVAGGFCASLAVLVRPNIALLAIPMALLLPKPPKPGLSPFSRAGNGDRSRFLAAALPAAAAMIALNAARYGSPFASGYGSTDVLFSAAHVWPNLMRYPRWLIETQSPLLLLAIPAPWILWRAGQARVAIAGALAVLLTFATYFAYTVFDDWWYIRFLLPALPILIVFSVVVLRRMAPTPIAVLICALVTGWCVDTAFARHVDDLRTLEARFRITGEYAARALPTNVVFLAVQQSGSLRFYAGRPTVAWDAINPQALDAAIDDLVAGGRLPLIALEDAEEPRFRSMFITQQSGQLDWPPRAEVHSAVRVRIYDPSWRAEHRAGRRIESEHIWK